MEINKETKKHLLQIIIVGILIYCGVQRLDVVIMAVRFVLGILMPFFIGGVIAFILNVPMKKIERNLFTKQDKYKKIRRPLAYILTLLLVFGVLVMAMVVVAPELADTIGRLVNQIPAAFSTVQNWIMEIPEKYPALEPAISSLDIDWSSLTNSAVDFVKSIAAGLMNSGVDFVSNIIGGVTTFVIGFTFSIYVLFQKEKLSGQFKQILFALLPEKAAEKILHIGRLSNQVFSNFLSGQCVEAVILGTMFVIAMTIFGMPYAMLTGIFIAITALIPIFGAFIGCFVGALLIFMVNPLQAVWFIVLFLVLQQLEGNLIYPHVVGNSIGLPSIWVLAAVTIGGNLFGIVGILVFIPLCSVLYALFREFVKKRLKERKIPQEKYTK